MEFRILGPLEVRGEPDAVELAGPKPRAVLAVLLLHANEAVSTDRLAQALWGNEVPAAATKTVQVHISRLRKSLGDPNIVVTTPTGYRMRVRPGELDAEQFDSLVKKGRVALAAGEPERAAIVLREALALWRGPPLADVEFEAFAQPEIGRLNEQRLAAIEARVEADLAAGRHAEVVGELRRLVGENPTRERLVEHLMLAFYRCGRQTDALELYRRARDELNGRLGLEPGPALKTLQLRILEQSQDLDLPVTSGADAGDPMPLPPALRVVPSVSYVGRVAVRDMLQRVLEDASAGSRQIVLFGGEPGVGKTRLAAHTALEAHKAGFSVSCGFAAEELGVPYGAWIDALSHLVEHAPDELLARHVAKHGGELSRLTAALKERVAELPPPRDSSPETERHALVSAVEGLLERMCSPGPVALLLDDLQWADAQSLALLRHLAKKTPKLPLVILGTYRDSDLPDDHPLKELLAELHRVPGVSRVDLGGLDVGEVVEFMTNLAGHDIGVGGRQLAAEVTEETGGNPFFVGQILRHLRDSGAVRQDDRGQWQTTGPIAELALPNGVHEVVAHRVARLGHEAKATLNDAAVVGYSFDVELLERLVSCGQERVLASLETATKAAVLIEPSNGRFAFAHALIQHSLYDSLGKSRRARTHLRVAQALEQLTAGDPSERLGELAHHWAKASDAAYPYKAAHYARMAGERALAQLAPADAIGWFTHALNWPCEDDARRCDALTGLGEAQRQVGETAFRNTLLEACAIAEALDDHGRLTRAVLANTLGPVGAPGSHDQERMASLERALALVPHTWPHRPQMLAVYAKELYYSGDATAGLRHCDEALALAPRGGDRRERARVLAFTTAISRIKDLDVHLALVDEQAELADELRDPELRFCAANQRFIWSMHRGDSVQLDAALDTMRELDSAIGRPMLHWTALWTANARRLLDGDLAQAETHAERAKSFAAQHGLPDIALVSFGQRLAIFTEWDRLEELADEAAKYAARYPRIGLLRLSCAFIAAETGHIDEATAILEQFADRRAELPFDRAFPFDRTRAFNLARCADIALRVGAFEHVPALYEHLEGWRGHFATSAGVSSRGSVDLSLGRLADALGNLDVARRHFEAAERAHERLRAPLLQARTYLAWGQALLADEPERAAGLLGNARTLAHRHGGTAIQREVLALRGAPARV